MQQVSTHEKNSMLAILNAVDSVNRNHPGFEQVLEAIATKSAMTVQEMGKHIQHLTSEEIYAVLRYMWHEDFAQVEHGTNKWSTKAKGSKAFAELQEARKYATH